MKIGGDRMTIEFMRDLPSKDEKITVEYKICQHGVQEEKQHRNVAFANSNEYKLCFVLH